MSIPEQIFIVGARGSGKTAFAGMLSDALRVVVESGRRTEERYWPVSECSSVLIGRLAEMLIQLPERFSAIRPVDAPHCGCLTLADWIKDILAHKESYRPALWALGAQLAADAPGAILTEACRNGRIVVGARRQAEVYGYYQLAKNRGGYGLAAWQGGNHAWVLVKRPNAPVDPAFDATFFELQVCRHTVFNTSSIDGLREQAVRLAEELCGA